GFQPVETTVGEVGGRLHLRWRLRLKAERLGAGWFVVEQQAYADTDEAGRIDRLDPLCTGYPPEDGDRPRSPGPCPARPTPGPRSFLGWVAGVMLLRQRRRGTQSLAEPDGVPLAAE